MNPAPDLGTVIAVGTAVGKGAMAWWTPNTRGTLNVQGLCEVNPMPEALRRTKRN